MPVLDHQRAIREVRNLPFCYLCTRPFEHGDQTNRDHVPPDGLFEKQDRNFPLILRAHKRCNAGEGPTDQRIGQLVGIKLGRLPSNPGDLLLDIRPAAGGRRRASLGVLRGFHVEAAIRRWLRGFHAALYRAPLPTDARFAIQSPLPSGRIEGDRLIVDEVRPQHLKFVETIKRNRAARNIDVICCNNGKLRYESVWEQADNNGPWFCIFALNVYNWIDIGDVMNFPARGCAGSYWSRSLVVPPISAAKGTRLAFSIDNRQVMDPFGI